MTTSAQASDPRRRAVLRMDLHRDLDVILDAVPIARDDVEASVWPSEVRYGDRRASGASSAVESALGLVSDHPAGAWLGCIDSLMPQLQQLANDARRMFAPAVLRAVKLKEVESPVCVACHEPITEESLPKNPAVRMLDGKPYHGRRGCYWAEYRRRRVALTK